MNELELEGPRRGVAPTARRVLAAVGALVSIGVLACDEIPDSQQGGGGTGGAGGGDPLAEGTLLLVPTSAEPTYVDLDQPAIVGANDAWELRFEGKNILTNGGVSGPGKSGAFGPNDLSTFGDDTVPADIPFLFKDEIGGAFVKWFAYDGAEHVLYSRFHRYGVRRSGELYKLQVIGFYGEQQGAPISGLYQIRWAKLDAAGAEATVTLADLDGTAGGVMEPTASDPSGCLRLSTGVVTQLTPAEAAASADWDVCFRRATISVNGGDGAAGDVEAIDLDAANTGKETLAEVMTRTADSELAAFDGVTYEELSDPTLVWLKDGVVSAFTNRWLATGGDILAPAEYSWLVAGSDGETPFFIAFEGFDGATAETIGTARLRVKHINGTLP